jgi:hypothetical protein
LSSMIMFRKCICAWACSIQIFRFNVFHWNRHSLTMLQLTPFESISKSMDFSSLSCNTQKKKLPIFSRRGFILHTHYLMFVQFCFSTWYVRITSTCKQTCACFYIYEIVKIILINFENYKNLLTTFSFKHGHNMDFQHKLTYWLKPPFEGLTHAT